MKKLFEVNVLSLALIAGNILLALPANAATSDCPTCAVSPSVQLAQLDPRALPKSPNATAVQVGQGTVVGGPIEGQGTGCCASVWKGPLRPMFFETLTGNVTQRYGVRFQPTPAFTNAMRIQSLFYSVSGTYVGNPNSLHMAGEMVELQPVSGTYPAIWQTQGPKCADAVNPIYQPTNVYSSGSGFRSLMAWFSDINNPQPEWYSNPLNNTTNWGHPGYMANTVDNWLWTYANPNPHTPNPMNTSNYMKPGRWYVLKLKLTFASQSQSNPWSVKDVESCPTRCVAFFKQSTEGFKVEAGATAPAMLAYDTN